MPCLLAAFGAAVAIVVAVWGVPLAAAVIAVGSDNGGHLSNPPFRVGWFYLGAVGAAIAAVVALLPGLRRGPNSAAALTAWGIVVLQAIWVFLSWLFVFV